MEVTKSDVEKLIEGRKENTFLNHLLAVITKKYQPMGEVRKKEIFVWRPNYWGSLFYPVFKFEFDNNSHLVKISDRISSAGIFVFAVLSIVPLVLAIVYFGIERWFVPFAIFVIFGILFFILYRSYKFEKQVQLDQIFEILEIETEQKPVEKEWSLKNILIRLFLYPFCLFLIFLGVFVAIPERYYHLTIICFAIAGFYFYLDIKMIMRAKKKG